MWVEPREYLLHTLSRVPPMNRIPLAAAVVLALAAVPGIAAAQDEGAPADTIRSIVLTEEMVVEGMGLPPAEAGEAEAVKQGARCSAGSMAVVCTSSLETDDRATCRRGALAMHFEAHFNAPAAWPRDELMVTIECAGHTTVSFSNWSNRSVWFALNTRPGPDGEAVERRELWVLHEEDPAAEETGS